MCAKQQRTVELRFYEELNDFLPDHKKRKSFRHSFNGSPTVQALIESIGVPHDQIDLILVSDEPVSFSHCLQGGEQISVFPVFERFDTSPSNRLRTRAARRHRFVAEFELCKLGRLLRLAGIDCAFDEKFDELGVIEVASSEKRIMLSSHAEVLKNGKINHGYLVEASDPPAQFREIIEAFGLRPVIQPLTLCTECNGKLRLADDSDVMDKLPFNMLTTFDNFWKCEQCGQIHWKGPHYLQLATLLEYT